MAKVKFGLLYNHLEELLGPVEMAEKAEAWGYHSFWATDFALEPNLEPLTLLAAAAQKTNCIQLGTAVLVLPYKHPIMLAKTAATVDVLSKGRLILGLGIGGRPKEYAAMGLDLKQRGRIADEDLPLLLRLFTEDGVTHHGQLRRLDGVTIRPRPVQRPHPPIWLGPVWRGRWAAEALRRTARLADGFLPALSTPATYREAQEKICRYARKSERDPSAIEWAVLMWFYIDNDRDRARQVLMEEANRVGDPTARAQYGNSAAVGTAEDCVQAIRQYLDLGVTHVVLNPGCPPPEKVGQYERFSREVMPQFKD